MVGERHVLFELPADEALDIDTLDDLVVARRRIEQGTVVFRLRANARVGSGHLYHCLQLADELADQRLRFLLGDCDPFVDELLDRARLRLPPRDATSRGDLEALRGPGRNVVVNDVLDTTEARGAGASGRRVQGGQRRGPRPRRRLADWVVNALYPVDDGAARTRRRRVRRCATLRGEFLNLPPKRRARASPSASSSPSAAPTPAAWARAARRLLARRRRGRDRRDRRARAPREPSSPPACAVRRHVRSMAAEMMDADLDPHLRRAAPSTRRRPPARRSSCWPRARARRPTRTWASRRASSSSASARSSTTSHVLAVVRAPARRLRAAHAS